MKNNIIKSKIATMNLVTLKEFMVQGMIDYEKSLRMVFKTPVKSGWRERGPAGTMAS